MPKIGENPKGRTYFGWTLWEFHISFADEKSICQCDFCVCVSDVPAKMDPPPRFVITSQAIRLGCGTHCSCLRGGVTKTLAIRGLYYPDI